MMPTNQMNGWADLSRILQLNSIADITTTKQQTTLNNMSWFGGGSKQEDSSPRDFSSHDEADFATSGSNIMAGAGGGSSGMQELQQASMVLQQQLLVQQVISDLCDRSYEKCITSRPSDSLNGTQVACIKATVNKWLDSNEFMTGRLAKKSQQQQQSHAY